MNEFLKQQLEIYFMEKPDEAAKICEQVLINKRSREKAEVSRLNLKKDSHRQYRPFKSGAEVQ